MNIKKKCLLFWVIFALLDPDPDSESGSGSTDPIESGSNPDPDLDPDPQPWLMQCVFVWVMMGGDVVMTGHRCGLGNGDMAVVIVDAAVKMAIVCGCEDSGAAKVNVTVVMAMYLL
jgi:hypothetical protein